MAAWSGWSTRPVPRSRRQRRLTRSTWGRREAALAYAVTQGHGRGLRRHVPPPFGLRHRAALLQRVRRTASRGDPMRRHPALPAPPAGPPAAPGAWRRPADARLHLRGQCRAGRGIAAMVTATGSDPGQGVQRGRGESTDLLTLIGALRDRLAQDDPAIAGHRCRACGGAPRRRARFTGRHHAHPGSAGATPSHDLASGLTAPCPGTGALG